MQFGAVIAKLVLTYVDFYAFQPNYHPPLQREKISKDDLVISASYVITAPEHEKLFKLFTDLR